MSLTNQQVFVLTQAVAGLITAMGMFVHDLHRIHHFGGSEIYTENAYEAVILDHGLHHNAVLHTLRD